MLGAVGEHQCVLQVQLDEVAGMLQFAAPVVDLHPREHGLTRGLIRHRLGRKESGQGQTKDDTGGTRKHGGILRRGHPLAQSHHRIPRFT